MCEKLKEGFKTIGINRREDLCSTVVIVWKILLIML